MQLSEILGIVAGSSVRDWEHVSFAPGTHSNLAVYEPDVDITIAWGAEHRRWVKEASFPDESASAFDVDVRYRGTIVTSWIYVSLDGGRHCVPLPGPELGDSSESLVGHSLSQNQMAYGELIYALAGHGDSSGFKSACEKCGFSVRRG